MSALPGKRRSRLFAIISGCLRLRSDRGRQANCRGAGVGRLVHRDGPSGPGELFRPDELANHKAGAGGVPVRKPEDLRAIYEATRTGNYPLLRCYSGTRDQLSGRKCWWRRSNNAWAAIPLTWYSQLDGRSQRPLLQTIRETQEAFKWHGDRGVPVESNESHHWSLRDAPDTVAVVMAFLAAYNARKMGVENYVAQYMFNNPPATSARHGLGQNVGEERAHRHAARAQL